MIRNLYLKNILLALTVLINISATGARPWLSESTKSSYPDALPALSVKIRQSGVMNFSQQDQNQAIKSMYTNGLAGSIATAIYMRNTAGHQYAFLTHNPRDRQDYHLQQVMYGLNTGLVFCTPNHESMKSIKIINAVPGEREKSDKMKPENFYRPLLADIKKNMYLFARENQIPVSAAISACYPMENNQQAEFHDFEIVLNPVAEESACFEKGSRHKPRLLELIKAYESQQTEIREREETERRASYAKAEMLEKTCIGDTQRAGMGICILGEFGAY